ncbi:MAG: hypothetical protein V4507_10800 [Verrucomicrobiota bacterium]
MIDFSIFAISNPGLVNIDSRMGMEIAQKLQPFSWLIATAGLGFMLASAWGDPKAILVSLILAMVTVACMASYPTIMKSFQDYFAQKGSDIESDFSNFQKMWNQKIPESDGGGGLVKSIQNAFFYILYCVLQFLGSLGKSILEWIQPYVVSCLIAISPITIAAFLIPYTRQIGITFLITSLGVCLWPIGTALADIFVAKIGTLVFASFGIAGAAGIGVGLISWPTILGAFLLMAVFMNVLYLSVPLGIARILSGASPAFAAAGAAAFMAAQAVPLSRGMSQLTDAIKGLTGKMGSSSGGTSSVGGEGSESSSGSSISPYRGGSPMASSGGSPSPSPSGGGGSGGGTGRLSGGRGGGSGQVSLPSSPDLVQDDGSEVYSQTDAMSASQFRKMQLVKHQVALDEKYRN